MSILVINAGSTSLKFGLFDAHTLQSQVAGSIDWPNGDRARAQMKVRAGQHETRTTVSVPNSEDAARCAIEAARQHHEISLVGHRVVHGGTQFGGSRLVDAEVKTAITKLFALAPLHNPPAFDAIQAAEQALPGVPQVAVFDTAFFAQLPPRAFYYPLPYEWREKYGVRRFGFHGISNSYCALRVQELMRPHGPDASLRFITCHLGGGCSATAVRGQQPVATTMGFSPLDGLMMGSRCGTMDPGLLVHLQRECGLTLEQIDHALNYESGLAGISGLCPDLAVIEKEAQRGNERAQLAFEMFADRVRSAIGSLAVTLGGVDAIVFTDRIGENSSACRAAICQGLECLGIHLDPQRNSACQPDADIAAPDSSARLFVIQTREEMMIAREALRHLTAIKS